MKLKNEDKKAIVDASKVAEAIKNGLKKSDKSSTIDLSKIAQDLADRREKVLSEE